MRFTRCRVGTSSVNGCAPSPSRGRRMPPRWRASRSAALAIMSLAATVASENKIGSGEARPPRCPGAGVAPVPRPCAALMSTRLRLRSVPSTSASSLSLRSRPPPPEPPPPPMSHSFATIPRKNSNFSRCFAIHLSTHFFLLNFWSSFSLNATVDCAFPTICATSIFTSAFAHSNSLSDCSCFFRALSDASDAEMFFEESEPGLGITESAGTPTENLAISSFCFCRRLFSSAC
mmetsp:Transcript_5876/g.14634  ORF Transcript_5876/g.14634 Transcript_5876/m.14634 type:complete len:233 (-) Transcript_5876:222-920(-)